MPYCNDPNCPGPSHCGKAYPPIEPWFNPKFPDHVFYVTEGILTEHDNYESCVSDVQMDDDTIRKLTEEFIKHRKNGPARLMLSNRQAENWK